jgi:2-polyprenylphenol 6-hydroxylase
VSARPDFDVLIVGGGMVGASMATLAAAHPELAALRIAVLEARPPEMPPEDDDVDVRVSAVSRASQRILMSIGAWQGIPERHLSPYDEMIVWDATGKPLGAASLHFSASATSEPNLGFIVENRRLQWSVYDNDLFRGRVTLLRGELAELSLDDESATVVLKDDRRITARLVVGSDGASSSSRKLAGIETRGWDYEQSAFVTHVRTEQSHRRTAWQRFLADGPIAFLPLADGRSSIVWTLRPDAARELTEGDPSDTAAAIERAIDGVFGKVELAGPRAAFALRLVHATDYCRRRFVLIGDAAHSVHPLAGQGVNLGFLDAAALVQVLAEALAVTNRTEDIASPRVLRRYERWRKSENTVALGLIDGLNRLFSTSNTALTWARRTGLSAVDRSSLAKRFFIGRAMGTSGELPQAAIRDVRTS